MSISRGKLVVLSSPSGGGKTTVAQRLLKKFPDTVCRAVTATTRASRAGEVEGVDYYFLSAETFQKKVEQQSFLEWAQVHDKYYGTPKDEVDTLRAQGKTVLLVIDVQGAATVRAMEKDAVTIFILPPGKNPEEQRAVLETRLKKRAQNSDDDIARRLNDAADEIARQNEFDYQVQNINLDETVEKVASYVFPNH